jgi:hypothetical protein
MGARGHQGLLSGFRVGPILTRESRVVLVARGHRFAGRPAICHEDLAGEVVSGASGAPREMMDAFFPPVTSSGRRIERIENFSWERILIMVAAGRLVHPTVPSFLDHFSHLGVVAVPIADLPLTETALVWLTDDRRAVIREFAQVARAVLESAEIQDHSE